MNSVFVKFWGAIESFSTDLFHQYPGNKGVPEFARELFHCTRYEGKISQLNSGGVIYRVNTDKNCKAISVISTSTTGTKWGGGREGAFLGCTFFIQSSKQINGVQVVKSLENALSTAIEIIEDNNGKVPRLSDELLTILQDISQEAQSCVSQNSNHKPAKAQNITGEICSIAPGEAGESVSKLLNINVQGSIYLIPFIDSQSHFAKKSSPVNALLSRLTPPPPRPAPPRRPRTAVPPNGSSGLKTKLKIGIAAILILVVVVIYFFPSGDDEIIINPTPGDSSNTSGSEVEIILKDSAKFDNQDPEDTSGPSGNSDTSGSSGQRGTAGSSGESGSRGNSGTSGSSGNPGASGSSGQSGTSGSSGDSGTSGSSGQSGTAGSSSESGTSGTSGSSGNSGTSGSSGQSGTSGSSGESGASGSSATQDQADIQSQPNLLAPKILEYCEILNGDIKSFLVNNDIKETELIAYLKTSTLDEINNSHIPQPKWIDGENKRVGDFLNNRGKDFEIKKSEFRRLLTSDLSSSSIPAHLTYMKKLCDEDLLSKLNYKIKSDLKK